MFRNYLTYSLALNFHRSCLTLGDLTSQVKERLMRSSETMIHHFSTSIHTKDKTEEATNLYVALICLRDCKEILTEAHVRESAIFAQYEIIHGRMEQLCLDAADKNGGQLGMLG